jgi:hypothetical protein
MARPRYLPPEERTFPVRSDTVPNHFVGDWVSNRGLKAVDGHVIAADVRILCPPDAADRCGSDFGAGAGAYNFEIYRPADRFWLFQYIETGLFVALAAVLIALAIRRMRKIA